MKIFVRSIQSSNLVFTFEALSLDQCLWISDSKINHQGKWLTFNGDYTSLTWASRLNLVLLSAAGSGKTSTTTESEIQDLEFNLNFVVLFRKRNDTVQAVTQWNYVFNCKLKLRDKNIRLNCTNVVQIAASRHLTLSRKTAIQS